ncbi:MAG: hypothetical protein ABI969_11575, partial [bacterium]
RTRLCGDGLGAEDGVVAGDVLDAGTKAPVTVATVTAFWREIMKSGASSFTRPVQRHAIQPRNVVWQRRDLDEPRSPRQLRQPRRR